MQPEEKKSAETIDFTEIAAVALFLCLVAFFVFKNATNATAIHFAADSRKSVCLHCVKL
jgi:hypothetical protein